MSKAHDRFRSMKKLVLVSLSCLAFGLSGCGKGSSKNPPIPGVKYSSSFVDGYFLLSVAFPSIPLDAGGRYPIDARRLPNSYAEIGPDFQSNGTLLVVALAASDVLNASGGSLFDPTTLPGGRPLPGIAAGALPGLALQLPARFSDVAVYFGNGAFGVFVPAQLGCKETVATFRFYSSGTRVGNISLVCEDASGNHGGFLALVNKDIPAVSRVLSSSKL